MLRRCQAFNARPEGKLRRCQVFNARPEGILRRYEAFNARPGVNLRRCQAFNARPGGATSSQPRASDRRERHPGLGRGVSDTPPEGAKAMTEAFKWWRTPRPNATTPRVNATSACPNGATPRPNGAMARSNSPIKSPLPLLLPPPGAYRTACGLTQGVARCARLPWAGGLLPLRGAR